MNQLMIAFITGLTTGGLSCLAVQGGLLTTTLAPHLPLLHLRTAHRRDALPATQG